MNKEYLISHLNFKTFYKGLIPSLRDNGKVEATGLCPFHPDTHPSLSVNIENGLYKCFACGASGDVFSFYQNLKGVSFPEAIKEVAGMQGITDAIEQKVVAMFEYRDEEGNLLYLKQRLEPGKNGRRKDFVFKHLDGNNKKLLGRGCDPVLYNLSYLAKSEYCFVVEGEAKVDLLLAWGFVATCLDSGANSPWRDAYLKAFAGKEKVLILPDSDAPGQSYALKIAEALYGKVRIIKIVNLPGLKESEDIIDWAKQEGNDKEKLVELVKSTPEWTPSEENKEFDPSILPTGLTLQMMEVSVEWLIRGLLPKRAITVLHGRGGIGKTWLSLQMAETIATGRPFLGLDTLQIPVYYIDYENPFPVLVERVKALNIRHVYFWHISNEIPPPALDTLNSDYYTKLPEGSLILFDTFRSAHTGDENDSKDISSVLTILKKLREKGYTILLLHHTSKGNDSRYKGSTAILDLCDHELNLCEAEKKEGEQDTYRKLYTPQKSRYQTEELTLDFDLDEGGFFLIPDQTGEILKKIYDTILKLSEDQRKKTSLIDRLKTEINLSRNDIRRLLNKGIDKLWTTSPGERNAIFYSPIPVCQFAGLYIGRQTGKLNLSMPTQDGKLTSENDPQPRMNTEFASLPDPLRQTEKPDLLEGEI